MFLSIFKLISLFFLTSGLVYFVYLIWSENTKLRYRLSAIFLGTVALGSFIAQLYVNVLFMSLVSLSIFCLLMLALDDELDDELEEEF